MSNVSDYLDELVLQKNALANNLAAKGVSASTSEKLNTLIPKVLEIKDSSLTPEVIIPVNHTSSFLDSTTGCLCLEDSRNPTYSVISIDLSLYQGKIIKIKNSGSRNYFGLFASLTDRTPQIVYSDRQYAANGELIVAVDFFYPRVPDCRYLCYDYTSQNQSQNMPIVTAYNMSDIT